MPLTRTTFLLLIKIGAGVLIAVIIIGYAIWGSLNYARGPRIDIASPANRSSIDASVAVIQGRADRVNALSLNGNPISIDEQGNFTENVVIFPGTNVLTFSAQDQFGRSTKTELDLIGTGQFPAMNVKRTNNQGTSTATST